MPKSLRKDWQPDEKMNSSYKDDKSSIFLDAAGGHYIKCPPVSYICAFCTWKGLFLRIVYAVKTIGKNSTKRC